MSKGILGWNQQDVMTQFQNGKAAMMVNGPWQIPTLRDQSPDLKWEVSTLPKDKQGASILGGENYSIIKGGPAGRTWPKTPTGRAIRYWPFSLSN